jgi:hypothetical protein
MNIPDRAVEAAVAAWIDHKLKPGNWTQEACMRVALEAAAPHLRAAWEADAALEAKADAAHTEWLNGE